MVAAIVVGLLVLGGFVQLSQFGIGAAAVTGATVAGSGSAAGAVQCQDDGTNTLNLAVQNEKSSTLQYRSVPVAYESAAGSPLAAGTATFGTALTYTALNVACGQSGTLYALGNGTENSVKLDGVSMNTFTKEVILKSEAASTATMFWRDSALGNMSAGAANMSGQITQVQAMASGGSLSFYLDLVANGTNGALGNRDHGVVIAVDLPTTIFSTANGFSLTGDSLHPVTKVDCPTGVAGFAAADVCFKVKQIGTWEGTVRFSGQARADLGEPTATTPIHIRLMDGCYFRDTDGTVRGGFANGAAADVCQTIDYTASIIVS